MLRKATNAQLEVVRSRYDTDRTGHLDVFDLQATLRDLGLDALPLAECRRLFEKHDERRVGQISLTELIWKSKATTVELMSGSPRVPSTGSGAAAGGIGVTPVTGPSAASRYHDGLTSRVVQLQR